VAWTAVLKGVFICPSAKQNHGSSEPLIVWSSDLSSGMYCRWPPWWWRQHVPLKRRRQYIPEDKSELHARRRENLKSHTYRLSCNNDSRSCSKHSSCLNWIFIFCKTIFTVSVLRISCTFVKLPLSRLSGLRNYCLVKIRFNFCVQVAIPRHLKF
jgi:hypothetical protein